MARLNSSPQLALDYHKFLVGCPHDDSNGPIIIAKPHLPSSMCSQTANLTFMVPECPTQNINTQDTRPLHFEIDHSNPFYMMLHETGVCCMRLVSAIECGVHDNLSYSIPVWM